MAPKALQQLSPNQAKTRAQNLRRKIRMGESISTKMREWLTDYERKKPSRKALPKTAERPLRVDTNGGTPSQPTTTTTTTTVNAPSAPLTGSGTQESIAAKDATGSRSPTVESELPKVIVQHELPPVPDSLFSQSPKVDGVSPSAHAQAVATPVEGVTSSMDKAIPPEKIREAALVYRRVLERELDQIEKAGNSPTIAAAGSMVMPLIDECMDVLIRAYGQKLVLDEKKAAGIVIGTSAVILWKGQEARKILSGKLPRQAPPPVVVETMNEPAKSEGAPGGQSGNGYASQPERPTTIVPGPTPDFSGVI